MRLGGDLDSHYEAGQECNSPHYRVSFWEGTTEDWVEIYEADVDEVLRWVDENADGRAYTIWARIRLWDSRNERYDIVDVRLHGTDPTSFDEDFPAWARRAGPSPRHPGSARASGESRLTDR